MVTTSTTEAHEEHNEEVKTIVRLKIDRHDLTLHIGGKARRPTSVIQSGGVIFLELR